MQTLDGSDPAIQHRLTLTCFTWASKKTSHRDCKKAAGTSCGSSVRTLFVATASSSGLRFAVCPALPFL
ncbi:hypothetical protein PI124_g5016 [Phytophthora idaei]|nr:hypothetical protein PI125_g7803 [Phytophthora idaei]KAG3164913.1 hypothetical protein PI126_g4887 [Phytophthora idaei]KAG3250361.1 hypothetical protein PI124_g5016 [Phytophthora idaei]